MEIKLFGKSLFEFTTKKNGFYLNTAMADIKESKFLPDFRDFTASQVFSDYVVMQDSSGGAIAVPKGNKVKKGSNVHLTPKGIYEMKMLNDESFELNVDAEYVDKQLADFKDKLGLIKSEEYDMARGVKEIASIISRLENRKKYAQQQAFFDQFPYTSSSKIDELVKKHDYMKLGQVASFLADMPKDAVDIMKDYNKATKDVCGKQAVFYIVADKKDFEKKDNRRDPILLAQSPFGHFWQILGAWDKEMLFLEEL